ncbi:MAG: hypothetical protein ACXW4Z_23280, partial [Candidatus Binatia bacterium]
KVWWFCLVVAAAFVGCGEKTNTGVATVGVSGTVYLDDKPLEDAQVNFVGTKHAGTGRTDASGKYYLVSGAELGENKIYFSKIANEDPAAGMDLEQLKAAAQAQGLTVIPGQQIPAEYASAEATTLTFTVPPEGSKAADFRLQSKK